MANPRPKATKVQKESKKADTIQQKFITSGHAHLSEGCRRREQPPLLPKHLHEEILVEVKVRPRAGAGAAVPEVRDRAVVRLAHLPQGNERQ